MLEKETGGVKKDSACVFHVRTELKDLYFLALLF